MTANTGWMGCLRRSTQFKRRAKSVTTFHVNTRTHVHKIKRNLLQRANCLEYFEQQKKSGHFKPVTMATGLPFLVLLLRKLRKYTLVEREGDVLIWQRERITMRLCAAVKKSERILNSWANSPKNDLCCHCPLKAKFKSSIYRRIPERPLFLHSLASKRLNTIDLLLHFFLRRDWTTESKGEESLRSRGEACSTFKGEEAKQSKDLGAARCDGGRPER